MVASLYLRPYAAQSILAFCVVVGLICLGYLWWLWWTLWECGSCSRPVRECRCHAADRLL